MIDRSLFLRKTVTVELNGQALTIHPLSLADRDKVRSFSNEHKDEPNRFAAMVSVLGCADMVPEDEEFLHTRADAALVDKLSEAILKLSGMIPESLEDAEKN